MKVAAYQAPLPDEGSMEAIALIAARVRECEAAGVSVLCCPEAILGGLADYSDRPERFAIRTDDGQLERLLAPLGSDRVTVIVGFTERDSEGTLYNTAAVFQGGHVAGLYRKMHPAIRRSVYHAGSESPIFRCGELAFGIAICNDSNFPELTRRMAGQGADAVFIPTNNGLPDERAARELKAATRTADVAIARENRLWVVRADVAGGNGKLTGYGCSEIVDRRGTMVREGPPEEAALLIAEIDDLGGYG